MADNPQHETRPKRVRTALADRMGFAWEPEELPDMTVEEAREILRLNAEALADGTIGNEDTGTLAYARLLVAEAKGNG
ncbi:MAG: hypothetical protein KA788_12595 [Lacunisphaera sp.]|nr:hypothetical protein [Lacunisphaera sp.]